MFYSDKSLLVLMVQNSHNVFCYFNISPLTVKEFEDRYGEGSWRNSKPVLKVYSVVNGSAGEIKTILLDPFADNWYIHLDRDDMDIFLKYGRILPNDTFASLMISNTVTTPRSGQSGDNSVYFVDTSHGKVNIEESKLLIYNEQSECGSFHRAPKPYPFMDQKKK